MSKHRIFVILQRPHSLGIRPTMLPQHLVRTDHDTPFISYLLTMMPRLQDDWPLITPWLVNAANSAPPANFTNHARAEHTPRVGPQTSNSTSVIGHFTG